MWTKYGLWLLVVVVAGVAPGARAGDTKPNAFTKTVSNAVLSCVRPSTLFAEGGYKPYILSHKYTRPKAGRLDLEVRMRWYGAFTKNPYEASFKIKSEFDGKLLEILGIDYTDDCVFPAPDLRLLNGLLRTLNKKFAEAAGGSPGD